MGVLNKGKSAETSNEDQHSIEELLLIVIKELQLISARIESGFDTGIDKEDL